LEWRLRESRRPRQKKVIAAEEKLLIYLATASFLLLAGAWTFGFEF